MNRSDWIAAAAVAIPLVIGGAAWMSRVDLAVGRVETKLDAVTGDISRNRERIAEQELHARETRERLVRLEARSDR